MARPGTECTNTESAPEPRGSSMGARAPSRSPADWRSAGRSSTLTIAAVVVAVHVALIVVLLQFESVRTAVTAAAPVMVTLISPPRDRPEVPPKPLPPKPQVRPDRRPAPQPPIVTAQPQAPSTYTAPPPPPTPVATTPVEVGPAEPVAVAPAPEPAPAPVIPPRFNAAYLNNPAPAYPLESRQLGEEGRVVLRVLVNEHGLPQEIQVRTSSGFVRLDTTAQDTVRRWKFVPARRGDTAVGAWVLVPMTFNLRN
jgi:protein TonB